MLSTFLVKPNIFGEARKTFKLKYVSNENKLENTQLQILTNMFFEPGMSDI